MLRDLARRLFSPPAPLPTPAAPAPPPELNPLPPRTAMEVIADHMERLQADLRRAETRAYDEHRASVADAEARVAAATGWVKRTGLAHAIPRIVDEVRPWAAWITRDDFRTWVPPDLYEIVATERRETPRYDGDRRETRHVEVRLAPGGTRYGVACTSYYSAFDHTPMAEANVYEDDDLRLTVSLHGEYDRNHDRCWVTYLPSVLVPGDWVAAIIAIDHRIQQFHARRQRAAEAERLAGQAAGLPDPGALS